MATSTAAGYGWRWLLILALLCPPAQAGEEDEALGREMRKQADALRRQEQRFIPGRHRELDRRRGAFIQQRKAYLAEQRRAAEARREAFIRGRHKRLDQQLRWIGTRSTEIRGEREAQAMSGDVAGSPIGAAVKSTR